MVRPEIPRRATNLTENQLIRKAAMTMNRLNRIGYQGIPGSNAEAASKLFVQRFAMEPATLVPLVTSKGVVQALREGSIDYGVMAVRNKIAGDVTETIDALQTIDYDIYGALAIPIRHCLFKRPDVRVEDVTTIAPHPQALLQTQIVRKQLYPTLSEVETPDTALAAKQLETGELPPTTMVLCSKQAGLQYGLTLVYEDLKDLPDGVANETEFLVVSLRE